MRDTILDVIEAATGGNIRHFSRLLNMPDRTLRAWITGENPVPGPAAALFRILAAHPKMIRVIEKHEAPPE